MVDKLEFYKKELFISCLTKTHHGTQKAQKYKLKLINRAVQAILSSHSRCKQKEKQVSFSTECCKSIKIIILLLILIMLKLTN